MCPGLGASACPHACPSAAHVCIPYMCASCVLPLYVCALPCTYTCATLCQPLHMCIPCPPPTCLCNPMSSPYTCASSCESPQRVSPTRVHPGVYLLRMCMAYVCPVRASPTCVHFCVHPLHASMPCVHPLRVSIPCAPLLMCISGCTPCTRVPPLHICTPYMCACPVSVPYTCLSPCAPSITPMHPSLATPSPVCIPAHPTHVCALTHACALPCPLSRPCRSR